ncbi:MAG TPA: DUF72 domain-containing protein [Thermoanaerobaculia bacterium]|jgi:uncharacterized protein YecE (DUF72 family)
MIHVGLCGWTINAADYFKTFDVVEVQQTFYEPPSKLVMARWREQAPAGFIFTIKAWQLITHRSTSRTYRRLRTPLTDAQRAEVGAFQLSDTVLSAWKTTRDCAKLLRAQSILFQCPASFRPTDEHISNMRRFFTNVERPKGVRFLWEPRGDAWSDELILALCRELDLTHAVDPFDRPTVTPEHIYWRLHGIGNHYHTYTDDELQSLLAQSPPGGEAFVMFNNIPRPGDAKRFMARLASR